jgi:hypothetical protein
MASSWFSAPSPVARRMRVFFAPVNRVLQQPVIFDPSKLRAFSFDVPPTPWIDLGWIRNFKRKSTSNSQPVLTGIPAATLTQVRETLEAQVSFEFLSWTKLTMALATGAQHMNLLASDPAVTVLSGSSSTSVVLLASDATQFTAGSMIAISNDYTGETGFVGSPIAGAYVRQALSDVDYIRRVTFNVALVSSVNAGTLTLATPLPGGAPVAGTKLQAVTGFVDREGGSFNQEWSALFAIEGSQGERIYLHYPRLQPCAGSEESLQPLDGKQGSQQRVSLKANFLALPITDALDDERVLCYRSFFPAPMALV